MSLPTTTAVQFQLDTLKNVRNFFKSLHRQEEKKLEDQDEVDDAVQNSVDDLETAVEELGDVEKEIRKIFK